ncbi:hypothetical protein RHGRI_036095 [Rhododendron griersonianum]|uniref:Uncharacterized protein n=1 Tax=Rhododendron griersonianum TaxID=479676 RepID=A0AAV6HLK4_9ERIC|nr:hypothetical protein RHGRI_036095 [Rhododendron griersonianum]
MSEKHSPFKDLKVESCELSCDGVSQLLSVLSTLTGPLNSLSIGGNDLGSKIGAPLGKFLGPGIQAPDIEGIELGPSGFLELQEEMIEDLKLCQNQQARFNHRLSQNLCCSVCLNHEHVY